MQVIPRVIFSALLVIGCLDDLRKHGRKTIKTYNRNTALAALAISFLLLLWGGFYGGRP